jgi:hypothetical protein
MKETDDARRALLAGLVDYAGLFPPAALSMTDAVRKYDEYRRGAYAWVLGRFVLPAARLAEFERYADVLIAKDETWLLAVLTGQTFGADAAVIADFVHRLTPRVAISAVEVKASTPDEVAGIAAQVAMLRSRIGSEFDVYVEVPIVTDPSSMISSIGSHGLRAKVRTGGVEAGAFPTAVELTRFLNACAAYDVTFKATAGLHHAVRGSYPLTYERASERGEMFGFLNVFLAALFARDGLGARDTAALLEERDANAFAFSAAGVAWRGRTVTAPSIRTARGRAAISFGSCSFSEPVADLSALGLL